MRLYWRRKVRMAIFSNLVFLIWTLALVAQGVLSLAFASLGLIRPRPAFVAAVLVLRTVQGLGGGVFETEGCQVKTRHG